MSFNTSNPVVVGGATLKSHFDRAFNNTIALKEARLEHLLGGSFESQITDTSFVAIPGAIYVELDGTNTGGLIVEVHAMAKVIAGTGSIQLWNRTLAALVGSPVNFTNTSSALVKITAGLSLANGVNVYELQVKGATAGDRPAVWGAKLILR